MSTFEQDELLIEKNDGVYPSDLNHKHDVLLPQIEKETIADNNRIHIGSYFSVISLKKAKESGFKIIILSVPEKILKERNEKRMREQNYDDANKWLQGELDYLEAIENQGLVSDVIEGTLSVEEIVKNLMKILKPSS